MTNLEDALVAVDAGADAVGFVFYQKSPRFVTVEMAREIVEKLPRDIEKVGVFVGDSSEQADEILRHARLTMAQVYASSVKEWLTWYRATELKLMLAIPGDLLKGEFFIPCLGTVEKPVSALLVDSGIGDRPGGTGTRFDWEAAKLGVWHLGSRVPMVVAGGLTPENVDAAIATMRPWGVDVVSGVESRPGKKDPEKVQAFMRAVREFDRKVS